MPTIADQLDAAIGAAPSDGPALAPTLELGRRAVRRRRLAYVAGAVATALVIGGTAWAVSPGDAEPRRSQDPGFAGGPSTSASVSPPAATDAGTDDGSDDGGSDSDRPWYGKDGARLDPEGRLEVRDGWTAITTIEEVNGPGTVGVEVAKGSRLQWFLFGKPMTIADLHAPSAGYTDFQEWIEVNGPNIEGSRPGRNDDGDGPDAAEDWPGVPRDDLVRFAPKTMSSARGLVAVSDDVVVVDQVYNPDLGASFAPPEQSGVAQVRKDGLVWYVVARRPDDYIAVSASEVLEQYDVEDLADFIAFAQERYAEGGGGLL